MHDTHPKIAEKMRELLRQKSPLERLKKDDALGGAFGKMQSFDWHRFMSQFQAQNC
jgi:hypothetical protein